MDGIIHSPITSHTAACACAICRSLHHARNALMIVPIEGLSNTPLEREAANLMIEAERLLGEAQNALQQYHVLERYSPQKAIQSPFRHVQQARISSVGTIGDGRPSMSPTVNNNSHNNRSSPTHAQHQISPTHAHSQSSMGYPSPRSSASPPKRAVSFEDTVKARAAELGILRSSNHHPPATPTTVIATSNHSDEASASPQKTKFLVCDHCRSHGLRCNEASVCKECIMREIPCTHRMCELSDSKDACPRTVCFYVHKDWMPDVYGQHNPNDENWLAMPGKLREHLSSGQLGKMANKTEKETLRCYQGVAARQQGAKQALLELVDSGRATWETASMACKCQEIEAEENRTRAVEDRLRRMALSRD